MKKFFTLVMILGIIGINDANAQTTNIFLDHFNGSIVSNALWHIPTWTGPTDGTFVGRTQFRCSQNSPLPAAVNSKAVINLDTYNPTGYSLYGTDLISNRTFLPGNGLIFTIYAKIQTPTIGGIVGGLFSYDLTTPGNHDEVDFELLTNQLDYVHTNIYSDIPLGIGNPDSSWISTPITNDHVYVITWLPTKVIWSIDGTTVRTDTTTVDGALHFHLNIWAPASDWGSAYNAALQPVSTSSANTTYSMLVDLVQVDSLLAPLAINEYVTSETTFYPNPAHDQIHFTTPNVNISIYAINGELIMNKAVVDGTLAVSDLSLGMYIIKYQSSNTPVTKKLVIQ